MFNITPYITLSPTQKKYYTFTRIGIFCLFILLFFLFVKEFIFPTQIFYFDTTINSLANTISRPYESQNGTSFHISTYGESDETKILLTLPGDAPVLPKNTTLLIKKSYLSFLSPINNQKYTNHIAKTYNMNDTYYIDKDETTHELISKNAFDSYLFKDDTILSSENTVQTKEINPDTIGFAPATLISSKDSIYVTDNTTKHPIQDERAFLALGYNFDNVLKTNSEERSAHKNAKLFTTRSAHPFGTIFYAQDADRTFIFDNNLLNKIPNTSTAKKHSIQAQEASRTTTASCILKKTLRPRQYTCTTSLAHINKFDGNVYQFALKDAPNTQINTINIQLFTTLNETALSQRIEALKRRLNTIYN